MRQKKSPLEGTNPQLESETLLGRLPSPVMLITYQGVKKTSVEQVDTYELHTTAGTFHKTDLLYVVSAATTPDLGDKLRNNTKIAAQNLTTAYAARERSKAVDSQKLRRAVNQAAKVTMLNGHVLYGTIVEYNAYNFIMEVNNERVLIYKHAVYEFITLKSLPRT